MSEKIERLEDIVSETMINYLEILSRYQSPVTTLDFEVNHAFSRNTTTALYKRNLVDYVGNLELTPRGAALIADYQRRHDGAASLKGFEVETIDDLNAQENSGLDRDTYNRVTGHTTSLEDLLAQLVKDGKKIQAIQVYRRLHPEVNIYRTSIMVKQMIEDAHPSVETLQAEIARLQEENAILTARNQELLNGLNELAAYAHSGSFCAESFEESSALDTISGMVRDILDNN